ncbi:MAG: FG-GAP repeat protein [Pirellulaceae bacterium]
MFCRRDLLILSLFTGALLTQTASVYAQKLTASDAANGDQFGFSVNLSGDSAIVGADLDDDNDFESGSAYYFRSLAANTSGATNENVKLTASDGAAGDRFGSSVSLSGDSSLIGAVGDDDNGSSSGSAYYFRALDTNTSGSANENVKLTASDSAAFDGFGVSVSLSEDSALIGANFDDDHGSSSGSAYYFRALNSNTSGAVTENVKLTASDGAAGDEFGRAISLSEDSALIGAFRDDDAGSNSGSAYYFRALDTNTSGSANENVKLTASDSAAFDGFGSSVSLSGDSALVGAYLDDDNGNNSGSAYYFRGLSSNASGAATENVKMTASDAVGGEVFGWSVSLSGDSALVGRVLGR